MHKILLNSVLIISLGTVAKGQSFNFKEFEDTLVLSAYVADCGEFGGREERIIIYKLQEDWVARFEKGEDCELKLIISEEFGQLKTFTQLDSITLVLIENYINRLKIVEFDNSIQSNAPTSFWVEINGKLYTRKVDPRGIWPQFQYVKEELFRKDSKQKY